MSTMRVIAIIGVCLLLEGCAPATSFKSLALLASLVAAFGSLWAFTHNKNEDRVCQKARDLDAEVTAHEKAYHKTSATVTPITVSTHKGNGVAKPDIASSLSQRN